MPLWHAEREITQHLCPVRIDARMAPHNSVFAVCRRGSPSALTGQAQGGAHSLEHGHRLVPLT